MEIKGLVLANKFNRHFTDSIQGTIQSITQR